MYIRIVKMTFKNEEVETFKNIFNHYKTQIASAEGCTHLKLLNDVNDSRVFFTYSKWTDLKYLEQYRNSELFSIVWAQTKVLFEAKAEAWSTEEI